MSRIPVKYAEFEVSVSAPGTADSGNLESDLPELLIAVAEAGKQADAMVGMFVDEGQRSLPFILFGAGLPMTAGLAGDAKSYAERLFNFPAVGPLPPVDAAAAIREPLLRAAVGIEDEAVALIVDKTQGYPYFLQEWGYQAWNTARVAPVNVEDVRRASQLATARLHKGFFQVRWDRLTPNERNYMRAMAELGPGPHRSGDIAKVLGLKTSSGAPIRSGLLKKGMVYSPQYGDTAFTVPMFDEYMKRAMPDWKPPRRRRA